jgi:hypothetical protein
MSTLNPFLARCPNCDSAHAISSQGTPKYRRNKSFATAVTHSEEARLLALFAAMKVTYTRIVRTLVFGDVEEESPFENLARELEGQKSQLTQSLLPFFESTSISRFLKIWHEPAAALLQAEAVEMNCK